MTSGAEERRKISVRATPARKGQTTGRDVSLLSTVADYVVLMTLQIALLFWPPSLPQKLKWWQITPEMAEELVARHPAEYLYRQIELGKWLFKTAKQDPVLFSSLDPVLQGIVEMERQAWLVQAIQQGFDAPAAFLSRPFLPSQWVSRACSSRLKFLSDLGLLEAEEQPTRLSEGRAPLLWYLTKKGRDFVADWRKVEPKKLDWHPAGSFSPTFLEHRIKTNDFRISVTLAAKRLGFEIKTWTDDHQLRRRHSQPSEKVVLTFPKESGNSDGEVLEKKVAIVPDGYFWLSTGEKNFHHFLEVDLRNVTGQYSDPGRKDWARKILAYSTYYTSGLYQQRYPEAGNSMRVLTVTTSQARLATLKEVTERVIARENGSGLNRYWFTTFDQIAPSYTNFFDETVLTGQIWQIGGRPGLYSLVW